MNSFVGFLDNSYLIYNDETGQLSSLTAGQVMNHIDNIWNLEIKNNKIAACGIDMSRFDMKNYPVGVVIKVYKDKKGNILHYLMFYNYQTNKISKNNLLMTFELNRRNGRELRIANLKFVYPESKKPYIITLGAEIPSVIVNEKKDRAEEQIFAILTSNMINGVLEVSERQSAELNYRINTRGIEPLVRTLEKEGFTYDNVRHLKMISMVIDKLSRNTVNAHLYRWVEMTPEGLVNFTRYSCDKEKLVANMKNYMDKLGDKFKREQYRFEQLF